MLKVTDEFFCAALFLLPKANWHQTEAIWSWSCLAW